MIKKGLEKVVRSAITTVSSTIQKRTYLHGQPFSHVVKNFPTVEMALKSATFQSFGDCASHHREVFDNIFKTISQNKPPAADKEVASGAPNVAQDSEKRVFTRSGFRDNDVEQLTGVTVDNVCKSVNERGMALLVHHDIGENYSTFHLVLVTNVFNLDGKPHALVIDCNDLAENPAAERARNELAEGMELSNLPEDKLKATNARESMVRVVALEPMLHAADKAYHANVEKYEAYENMEGRNPMPCPIAPALIVASKQFLAELPDNAKQALVKDDNKLNAFAKLMEKHRTQIEFSKAWQEAKYKIPSGRGHR